MSLILTVAEGEADRVDRWLRRKFPQSPRREIEHLFDSGSVRRAGNRLAKGDRVAVGDRIEIPGEPAGREQLAPAAESIAIEVLYEDATVVAIAKPAGIPTHPLHAGETGTLANRVVARYPECASASREIREGGAVQRLDRGTSGVILFARSRAAHDELRAAFSAGRVSKTYLALTSGRPDRSPICEPLEQRGARVRVSANGLPAITHWRLVASHGDHSLLECEATTGRMHQIRAHLADAGAPIVGDEAYGGSKAPAPLCEFFLHASSVRLALPSGTEVELHAPLPPDRLETLAALGFERSTDIGKPDRQQ